MQPNAPEGYYAQMEERENEQFYSEQQADQHMGEGQSKIVDIQTHDEQQEFE
jgi:hypothetical protein